MASRNRSWEQTLNSLAEKGAFPSAVHRILVYGPPRTGKTSWCVNRFPSAVRVQVHAGTDAGTLLGTTGLRAGATEWQPRAAALAMREGRILQLDDIHLAPPECQGALHSILDAREIACISSDDGATVIRPREGFGVYCTTNSHPDELPEPVRERFDCIIHADAPSDSLLGRLSDGAKALLRNHYARNRMSEWTAPVNVTTLLALESLAGHFEDREEVASILFGESAQETLTQLAVVSQ